MGSVHLLATPRSVLITHRALFNIGGSELTAYEISRHYASQGSSVAVYTHGASPEWRRRLEAAGVTLVLSTQTDVDHVIGNHDPALIWVGHSLIPEALISTSKGRAFVFLHLSSFEPLEFVRFPVIESQLAGKVLFVSEEALSAQRDSGLTSSIPPNRMGIWGNPVPDTFFEIQPPTRSELKRLLVVSNHLPQEFLDALPAMRETLEIRILGAEQEHGAESRVISEQDFEWADAVFSIGKTVQMAIAASRPVFCFDIHGGPGWLGPLNVERALEYNFSGRGFEPNFTRDLAAELRQGFSMAAAAVPMLRAQFGERFRLSSRIKQAVSECQAVDSNGCIDAIDRLAYSLAQRLEGGYINAIEARNQTIEYCMTQLEIASRQLQEFQSREQHGPPTSPRKRWFRR